MAIKNGSDNTSQRHGIDIENIVKTLWMFSNATNVQRSGIASFDIEGKCDPLLGLNTSVKSTGSDSIGLADAVRFCGINLPWRMLVVEWKQDGDIKSFYRFREMIIPLRVMRRIIGDLTEAEVLAYHNEIASFAPGAAAAAEARRRYREIKKAIQGRHGILRLDFKVDELEQRRLQASLRLSALVDILESEQPYVAKGVAYPLHRAHEDHFHQIELPLRLRSIGRRIDKEASPAVRKPVPTFFGAAIPHNAPRDVPDPAIFKETAPLRRDAKSKSAKPADTGQIPMF